MNQEELVTTSSGVKSPLKIGSVSLIVNILEETKKTLDDLDREIPAMIIMNDRMLQGLPKSDGYFGIVEIQIIDRPYYPYGYFSVYNRFGEAIPESILRKRGFLCKKQNGKE